MVQYKLRSKKIPITATALLQMLVIWSKTYPPSRCYVGYPYWIDMLKDIVASNDHLFHYYIELEASDLKDLLREKFYAKYEFHIDWCDTPTDIFRENVKCTIKYVEDLASLIVTEEIIDHINKPIQV